MATAADGLNVRVAADWRIARAPAKVNLGLRIIGRRDDGYHLLDSLVAFAGVSDHVAIRPAPDTRLTLRGPFAAALAGADPSDNLATNAARDFRQAFGGPEVEIRLWKRLPVAAGIGGGSSDAAAVLRLLALDQGIALDDPDLLALALGLGADTPMCLASKTVRAGGIGETFTPAPTLPPLPAVLANPGVMVSTPRVFKARTSDFSTPAALPTSFRDISSVASSLRDFGNDLTAPASVIAPIIRDTLQALGEGSLFAGMSGSGATCFALFDTVGAARAAAQALRQRRPNWWVAATQLGG